MSANLDPFAELERPFGSFPGLLAAWGRERPDACALRDERGELTWREAAGRLERIAARLQADGLERGQAVAILGASSIEYALVSVSYTHLTLPTIYSV